MRKDSEIKAEIEKLRALLDKVADLTAFRESNHADINAQIRALERRWTEDDAWDYFETLDEDREVGAAIEAILWMREENEQTAPSAGWEDLAR